jgi:hypothetical protein
MKAEFNNGKIEDCSFRQFLCRNVLLKDSALGNNSKGKQETLPLYHNRERKKTI